MPPLNRAAYLVTTRAVPLEVRPAPYTPPGPDEIVVKNGAIAVNPVDSGKQRGGDHMLSWIKYPFVLGSDVAGEVVEVGTGGRASTLFKPGDRVVGHAVGLDRRSGKPSEGAFQLYTVLRSNVASKIPDNLSYEKACVLPMGVSTAACGLFMKDFNALRYPTSAEPHQQPAPTFIVWGGSTSVGSNAIQLARAAGYDVFATSSPKNFEYVKALGAAQAFDYNDPKTVGAMVAAFKDGDRTCAGAIAIGKGSLEACVDIVGAVPGRKFVAQTSVPISPSAMPSSSLGVAAVMLGYMWWNFSTGLRTRLRGVTTKFIWASDVAATEIGEMIYNDFLTNALETGRYQVKPEPQVVGKGLEHVQEALDTNMRGVSATKVVVTL
ncbi:zinc-binding oxidoreductase CipB [Hypoxylon rubiginosum]|uniref:Zinc-binding oxidoreductase CipB n=1 Tax=Hypoxylon rubiginosum TaxID=110542 RepID=A0ACB9YJI9_9PEZI|nr:zinc-binding oxidoreductase CipB [Hypoxylon rubiginosum]UOS85802.1 NADP-dependent oxidoreductase (MDR) [Hypoxylon rubiginosum]